MKQSVAGLQPEILKAIRIRLASPETIRSWSYGEVKTAETINYRTQRPEKHGLFCETIFGPIRDFECACGAFKGKRFAGTVCDKCGVEVTTSSVRRERMGHIELAVPVAHIWFYKIPPSTIALLLDINSSDLESILYYDKYIVIDPGDTPLLKKQVLTDKEYEENVSEYKDGFLAEMGAPAIKKLLKEIDLDELSAELRVKLRTEKTTQMRGKVLKRLQIVDALINSGNKPEWMILEVLPVIPPDLRPLFPLEGGRYATSDLNDLYRRVINRNNRIKNITKMGAPEIILRNEKRLLQEAVDALLDNSRRSRPVMGKQGKPYKSLSDMLRGKKGRFRRNLLGKRVDYSGRSVIVVGPDLKLNEIGLPKEMALELFRPFVERRLEKKGIAESLRSARKLVRERPIEVWEILEDIVKDHPVLLNRAPTLHRVSIQAFYPKLIEGKAIQLHPLVCAPFNADFDGDQMAVHVPISPEARLESHFLMLSRHNILSPAHGAPLISPSQDLVIGLHILTKVKKGAKGEGMKFGTFEEALIAYELGKVELNAEIEVDELPSKNKKTTPGRIIFNRALPKDFEFINEEMTKKKLSDLVRTIYVEKGSLITEEVLDKIKELGFYWATISGVTFGIDEMIVPPDKKKILKETERKLEKIENDFLKGRISSGERYNAILDLWTEVTEILTDKMVQLMKNDKGGFNSIYMMMNSGARGSLDQVKQLAAMRGLMARPKRVIGLTGEFIETPIKSNLKEGMTVLEYFISTHGARKGLADTALKTADAGYLTRRLVDVAQSVVIIEEDCGTIQGREVSALKEGETVIETLKERIEGHFSAENIRNPFTGEIIVKVGELITEEKAEEIEDLGIEKVKVRHVLTCESKGGICVKCYGKHLGTGRVVEIGEPVGVLAAQSIGEPGTQLTLRTFHVGGAASRVLEKSKHEAPFSGTVEFINLNVAENSERKTVSISKKGLIRIIHKDNPEIRRNFAVPQGAEIHVKEKSQVEKGDILCEWEPYIIPILATKSGKVKFIDLEEGITYTEAAEEGKVEIIVMEDRTKKLHPAVQILDFSNNVIEEIALPKDARIVIRENQDIKAGDFIAKLPREAGKTRDITGGLPRVNDLFEAKVPKDKAILAEISGIVKVGKPEKGFREIKIISESGLEVTYKVSYSKYLLVDDGEKINAGEPLTLGPIDPHDILRIKGRMEVQEFLLDQIQEIYRLSGVRIHDKHIGIIVRQMMRNVKVEDPGDTHFVRGQFVNIEQLEEENKRTRERGGRPAVYSPVLLGISKAALSTESFISAASFQETTRVLSQSALYGKRDELKGLKENVIVGSLIPCGTGLRDFQQIKILPKIKEEERYIAA
ncbi:MAG: DNA-directed RNA polymerase subunit beta' [Candidatus Hydrothermales bacterium]